MKLNETGYNWLLEKVARGLDQPLTISASRAVVDGYAEFDVTVEGDAPRIPGHTFVGTVEHLDEGNILKAAPGHELPAEYRRAHALCQHCGLVRRRSQTYVLATSDGCHIQVGRNCLADYLRSPDAAEHLLAWAGAIDELLGAAARPEFSNTTGGRRYFGIEQLVRLSIAYSTRHPWVNAAQSRETGVESSAAQIRDYLNNPKRRSDPTDPMVEVEALADGERVAVEAQHVADWVSGVLATKPDESVTNYESNLVVAFRQGHVTADHIPLVCSAHRAYYGYRMREERRSQVTGEHVGVVGGRGEFRVVVKSVLPLGMGDYGERFLVRMEDETGNLLVWFTGESCSLEESPDPIWVKATVTEHGEFNGRKQTVVNRVKVIPGPTPPKPPKKPRGKKVQP